MPFEFIFHKPFAILCSLKDVTSGLRLVPKVREIHASVYWAGRSWLVWQSTVANTGATLKADSHIACRAHAVPLPCRAAKGLEFVFPIWFTQCGRVWFMPRPCPAPIMTSFSSPMHMTAGEWRPVDDRPAFGFFRLPRGVPRRLLSEAYESQIQVASVKPNVCHGRGKEW